MILSGLKAWCVEAYNCRDKRKEQVNEKSGNVDVCIGVVLARDGGLHLK